MHTISGSDAKRYAYRVRDTPCGVNKMKEPYSEFEQGLMSLEPHHGSETRLPDVKVVERDNQTIVLGCRCIKRDFRGISTFDRKVTWFGSKTTKHFVIPANTPIPAGIAITNFSLFAAGLLGWRLTQNKFGKQA